MSQGLINPGGGPASPHYSNGPYIWDQHVTFSAGLSGVNSSGSVLYVDGTNGSDGNNGFSWTQAKATIQAAVTAAGAKGTVFVAPKAMAAGATDPASYEENIVIPATHESMAIIGVSRGRTQGGLPQLKDGAITTQHILVIRSPGCLVQSLGFNGAGNTGGGILLDDDSSTKTAFGTSIIGCHFKNCKGPTANNAATGGAICWSANGGAWQVLISGNKFYKCAGDIVMLGTSQSVPQDVVIENCVMSGPAANVDCNIYVAADGINGIVVDNCVFGQLPALGGTNDRYIKMSAGTVGMITNCTFGCQTSGTGGTIKTFKSGGTAGDFPTTVHIARCFGQSITADATGGEISIA